jgi:hypothetical protein
MVTPKPRVTLKVTLCGCDHPFPQIRMYLVHMLLQSTCHVSLDSTNNKNAIGYDNTNISDDNIDNSDIFEMDNLSVALQMSREEESRKGLG